MSKPDEGSGTQRNPFEAFLKADNPNGYHDYIRIKKEALKNGQDPIEAYGQEIARTDGLGHEMAMQWRLLAIGKRLMEPEDRDIEFLRAELLSKGFDLDDLVDALGDRRKVADIIRAIDIARLGKAGFDPAYMIVDRLLVKGHHSGKAPTGTIFIDRISEKAIAENPEVFELLKKYGVEVYQKEYEEDYEKARNKISRKMDECAGVTKKLIYKEVIRYYDELEQVEIPGIITSYPDPRTGEIRPFPLVYQKIGAREIAVKKRMLIADEMGLGKTAQAIIAKNLIDWQTGKTKTAIAVVPGDTIAQQWIGEIAKWNAKQVVRVPSSSSDAAADIVECKNGTVEVTPVDGKKLEEMMKDRSDFVLVAQVTAGNKAESVEMIMNEKPDFVVTTYDMIFRKINGKSIGEALSDTCDYLILDEIHKAKNFKSRRGSEILGLSGKAGHVAMLSGTPVPGRIEDLGVVACILCNHEISPQEFNARYKKKPAEARNIIASRMLRRRKEDTYQVRRCKRRYQPIPMGRLQELKHQQIMLNREKHDTLKLITELRKCSLDPALLGVGEDSPKYAWLVDQLMERRTDPDYDGTPSVVFSSELKEGVLDRLCKRLENEGFRVGRIDGDRERTGKKRAVILDNFHKGEYDVLVATRKTMGEGVNCLVISHVAYLLDVPFDEKDILQAECRFDRNGQKSDSVDFTILVSEDSIDELLLRLIEQKKRLGEFLVDGIELTDAEKRMLEDDSPRLIEGGPDPLRRLYSFFGRSTNRCSEDIIPVLQNKEVGEWIGREYWENFEGSFYGNTSNFVASLIRGLENERGEFKRILDVASGPCCLARSLGRPLVSLDANPHALKIGMEKIDSNAGVGVCASFTNIPFEKYSFDAVVFSLGLLHSVAGEREGILRGINRVMKKDGLFVLTLPSGEGRYEKLTGALRLLGFEVLENLTGTARDADGESFECVVISAKKIGEPSEDKLPEDMFEFHNEKMESESYEASISKTVRRKVCTTFSIDEMSIGEAVGKTVVAESIPEIPLPLQIQLPGESSVDEIPVEARGDPAQYLIDKYGSARKVRDNCPPEELERFGLVIRTYGRKSIEVVHIMKKNSDTEQMETDHKDFVSKRDRSNGRANGKVRVR